MLSSKSEILTCAVDFDTIHQCLPQSDSEGSTKLRKISFYPKIIRRIERIPRSPSTQRSSRIHSSTGPNSGCLQERPTMVNTGSVNGENLLFCKISPIWCNSPIRGDGGGG